MTKQMNRGKDSGDDALFGTEKFQSTIQEALLDMRYLLSRGFGDKSTLLLVGNRYRLNTRQQKALLGMSASDAQIERRKKAEILIHDLKDQEIAIDGFNLVILLESMLSNAYVFKGLDGCYRDLSSIHGSYKKVSQTPIVIRWVAEFHLQVQLKKIVWVLDRPVSNSGRLKQIIEEIALEYTLNWTVILDNNPDKFLAESNYIVVTSDAWILDRVRSWFNLGEYYINEVLKQSK